MTNLPDRTFRPESDFNRIDFGVGLTAAYLTGVTIVAVSQARDRDRRAQIDEDLRPLNAQQALVGGDITFLNVVTAAINSPTYHLFIDSIGYDGKVHQPATDPTEEASIRDFNNTFIQRQKDPQIGPTLLAVNAAASAGQANDAIQAEYRTLDAKRVALTAETKQLHEQRSKSEFAGMVTFDVGASLLVGTLAYLASNKFRHEVAFRRSNKIMGRELQGILEVEAGKAVEIDRPEDSDKPITHPETQPGD